MDRGWSTNRTIAATIVAAIAVGIGAWALVHSPSEGGGEANPTFEVESDRETQCFGPVGSRAALSVTTETEARIDLMPLLSRLQGGTKTGALTLQASPPESFAHTRAWRLELERQPDAQGMTVLAAHIRDPKTIAGEPVDEVAELEPVFLIGLDEQCGVSDFARQADAPLEASAKQQAMVAELSVHRPRVADDERYTSSGFDVNGRYETLYRTDSQEAPIVGRITRYRRRFSNQRGSKPKVEDLHVVHSRVVASPDDQTWLLDLEKEREISYREGDTEYGHVKMYTRARPTRAGEQWEPLPDPNTDAWIWGHLFNEPLARSRGKAQKKRLSQLSTMVLDDALAKFVDDIRERRGNSADWVTFMRDWLRANPDQIDALLARMQDGWLQDEHQFVRSNLFLALGLADTEETRGALMSILTSGDFPAGYELDAAAVLTKSSILPDGYVDLVLERATFSENTFQRDKMVLTLGLLAEEQRHRNPEAAVRADAQLSEWLDEPKDSDQLYSALVGAGNSGGEALTEAVTPHLSADDPTVRAAAAEALRRNPTPAAQTALTESYLGESDPGVRATQLRSIVSASRQGNIELPTAVVESATARFTATMSDSEFVETAGVLGIASQQGDTAATEALQGALRETLSGPNQDLSRARTLGTVAKKPYRRQ